MLHYRRPVLQAALVLVLVSGTACATGEDTEAAPQKAPSASTVSTPTTTSNGVENLSPHEILDRARKATGSAQYVRMRGKAIDEGEKVAIDFRMAKRTNATGWLEQNSERITVTKVARNIYIKGNDPFWASIGGQEAVQLLSGKHLRVDAENPDFSDVVNFTDQTALLASAVKEGGEWKKSKEGKIGDTPTVVLTNSAGESIHVATQGQPYVLLLEEGPDVRLEYLEYGKPVNVQGPPAGSVIDVNDLG